MGVKSKKEALAGSFFQLLCPFDLWCAREDLNLHSLSATTTSKEIRQHKFTKFASSSKRHLVATQTSNATENYPCWSGDLRIKHGCYF